MKSGKLFQYFVFGAVVIALFAFWNRQTNALLNKLHSSETAAVAPATVPAVPAVTDRQEKLVREQYAQVVQKRLEAEAAETARIVGTPAKASAVRPAPVPRTEPQHWYAPELKGRVYSNGDFGTAANPPSAPPDRRAPVLIVDLDPKYGDGGLDLRAAAADRRLGCATYPFQPDPKSPRPVNRLYCGQ